VHELLSDALALYSAENGLNVLAFPSIGVMQHDIVSNTASLLGATTRRWRLRGGVPDLGRHREPAASCEDGPRRGPGARHRTALSGGGRERARRVHEGSRLLRRGVGAVPVDADFRVRADALAEACTDDTIMVVGSAPTYPKG